MPLASHLLPFVPRLLDPSSLILHHDRMALCAISLGGNIGDVPGTFSEAVHDLNESGFVSDFRMSRLYRTAPMGAQAGDAFYNAAAVFESTGCADQLLTDVLQKIERTCGRVRNVRWGPRTLDLDLLLYGEEWFASGRLVVPHPAMWYRRFVLDPLVELIPDTVHPVFRMSIRQLRERLLVRPLPVLALGPSAQSIPRNQQVDTLHWLSQMPSSAADAAIVFAGPEVGVHRPHFVQLPENTSDAAQLTFDVLTAALDEPAVVS